MKKVWPFSVNFFIYAGFAFVGPFIVIFYQDLGFTGGQIGLLTGITPLVTFFSAPLWTRLADATRKHRAIMSLALMFGGMTIFMFPFVRTFTPLMLLAVLFNMFFAPVTSLTDNATMTMLGDEKEMYGRIRLGGTIGFVLAPPISGVLVQNFGLQYAFWGCAVMFLVGMVVSQKLVHGQPQSNDPVGGGIPSLLRKPNWLIFLAVALAGGIASVATNIYLYPYMEELGATESLMGLALTIGVLAEIPVMVFGNRIIKRFGSYGMLMLAMVFTVLRLILFAATGNYYVVLAIQVLNGLTHPAMWVAGVSYANEIAPEGLSATAQGLFAAMVFGIGSAAGGFISGPLLESMGGRGLFLVIGVIVLVITAVTATFQMRLDRMKEIIN